MISLLLNANATVICAHSKNKTFKRAYCTQADIIVVAIEKEKFLTADMVKDGAIIIDVGINRDENNKIVGDVDLKMLVKEAIASLQCQVE